MKNVRKFLKSKKGKMLSTGAASLVAAMAVLVTAVYLSNGTLSVRNKQDTEQEYGDGITLINKSSLNASGGTEYGNLGRLKVEIAEDTEDTSEDTTTEGLDLEKLRDEQISKILEENGLTMYDFVNYKDQIADSVLLEIQKVLEDYDKKMDMVIANQGAAGRDGKDGKNGTNGKDGVGKAGKDGNDGKDGKAGQRGATGATGPAGKAGSDGKDGKDGNSMFIKYSANADGTGMTAAPSAATKYMGTYVGQTESSNPADYTWTRYSDATISYSDGTLYITQ